MTVKEAAKYLDVSVDTVYRMARAGELPHFKIRSLYRFEKAFLDEWKKRQQEKYLESILDREWSNVGNSDFRS